LTTVTKTKTKFQDFWSTRRKLKLNNTRMWTNAQRDGRPAEYRWRPLFSAAKFG